MYLTTLSPYKAARTISDVFQHYYREHNIYSYRIEFTKHEYRCHQVKLTGASLYRCLALVIFNWSVITAIALVSFQTLFSYSNFIDIFNETLNVRRFDLVLSSNWFMFISLEFLWWYSYRCIIQYRFLKHEVVAEYDDRLDKELPLRVRTQMVKFFITLMMVSSMVHKICLFSIMLMAYFPLKVTFRYYQRSQSDALKTLSNSLLIIAYVITLCWGITLLLLVVTYEFFIFRIFLYKLKQCYKCMLCALKAVANGRYWLYRFEHEYIRLHFDILRYNFNLRDYFMVLNVIGKVSTLVTIMFFSKQSENFIHPFSVLIISLFLIASIYEIILHWLLTSFPARNSLCYFHLCSLNSQWHMAKFRWRISRNQLFARKVQRQASIRAVNSDVRLSLKLHSLIEFTAVNRFGFTVGNYYLITKWNVIQVLASNLFIIVLLYEKMPI